jgi:hypothetical protein
MAYFQHFPQGYYQLSPAGQRKLVVDVFRRIKVRDKIINEASLYDMYQIREGDTPESLAFKYYQDSELHWVILLTNNITDRYYGWPLNNVDLDNYIRDRYTNPDAVHHFERNQTSGDTTIRIETQLPDGVTIANLPDGYFAISNTEYEQRLNDEKRDIRILSSEHLGIFLSEFENLITQ